MGSYFLFLLLSCFFVQVARSECTAGEETICKNNDYIFQCTGNRVIKIQSMFYGRRSDTICGSSAVPAGGCSAKSALGVLSSKCNGKRFCYINTIPQTLYGDPCAGVDKYIQVSWKCIEGGTDTVCEHSDRGGLDITCNGNKVIKIHSSFYGRDSSIVCGNYDVPDEHCSSASAQSTVISKCDGERFCRVPANNDVFGDPCWGVRKYLTVSWTCEQQRVTHKQIVCERVTAQLSCPEGTNVSVTMATYGRSDPEKCNRQLIPSDGCDASNALMIVRKSCDYLQSCILEANNNQFGHDPCPGTQKYLEVDYQCI